MGIAYLTTEPIAGDPVNVLLAKWLQCEGGEAAGGDTEQKHLSKILFVLGGTPFPDDTENNLYAAILRQIGGIAYPDDTDEKLLREIALIYSGERPSADSTKWDMLSVILRNCP